MGALSYRMERSVVIQASRETVFLFFTDSARWAKWWGEGSSIDARAGGKVLVRQPGGAEALGEALEVLSPERIVFTYGYASGKPIPPGSSQVSISLETCEAGTRLHLLHEFAEAAARDEFVQGWRFQLSLFANPVSDEVFGNAVNVVDRWYEAWAVSEEPARSDAFARIAAPDVCFRDCFSLLNGLVDLSTHAGAAQRFMPGVLLRRRGEPRQCQGMVLADWVARGADGRELMTGSSVFVLALDGRIGSATSFAHPTAAK